MKITQNPLALKIPGKEKELFRLMLVIFIEVQFSFKKDERSNRHYCRHASGQLKPTEQYYHISHKEILEVKRGIHKFEFYLISHHFVIQIDNSSFSRALDFKIFFAKSTIMKVKGLICKI